MAVEFRVRDDGGGEFRADDVFACMMFILKDLNLG
jgi:hypothetical protein